MSDFNEMAEALEQSRTCPEAGDKAAAYQVLAEISGVAAVRARMQGEGRPDCLDCGEEILPARRKAVENAVRCKECQDDHDKREGRRV
ncbi:TraR/DksA family transcriptional regulator [Stutzerimonas nosocomialis]|uniref:TraR/DksA C4-type zinc finger protein n=1 Tax=Stutzerimonas nosocomialis TaxID=1056496 RepID=UPI001108B051|nr:TraR/DksA C4-type zinc finger protein [Stutzerimonas nosocomialis]TLX53822.1 TraR/DksA family transcriptional regulator [Stutzerimonas nosocomialis]